MKPARAHAPRGLRLGGMVNTCEPLINVVNVKEPNALIGSNQKVCSSALLLPYQDRGRYSYRRKGGT